MNMKQLGMRATACKAWRWLPGMKSRMNGVPARRVQDDVRTFEEVLNVNIYPDLTDPATLGCVLALVREAWKEEDMGAFRYDDKRWCVEYTLGERQHRAFYGATEAEALVAALEAAT